MASELVDRIACRIFEETRLARLARHPRARIAHYMLADAYRAMANRLLLNEQGDPAEAPIARAASARYSTAGGGAGKTGFLTDLNA